MTIIHTLFDWWCFDWAVFDAEEISVPTGFELENREFSRTLHTRDFSIVLPYREFSRTLHAEDR